MNWSLLVNSLLAFGLLFVVLITLTFFINYKRDRKAARKQADHPSKGRYFVRHIPEALGLKYKLTVEEQTSHKHNHWEIKKFRMISRIPVTVFSVTLIYFAIQFGHQLRGATTLTENELENLKYIEYQWRTEQQADAPQWNEVKKNLKGGNLILLSSSADVEWIHPLSAKPWVRNVLADWRAWAASSGVPLVECEWSRMNKCVYRASKDVFVVVPGSWDTSRMDHLLSQGASVLILGAPLSIFTEQRSLSWNDITFERSTVAQNGPLILAGDQLLTLGWNAGKILPFAPTEIGYRVRTEIADAYRLSSKGLFTEQVETALHARTVGQGRLVWADYSPRPKMTDAETDESVEQLNASVFRFLLRKPYDSIATWPEGKTAAAFLSSDVEEDIADLKDLLAGGLNQMGWFLLSSPIEKQRQFVRPMAEAGDLNCHGDNHEPFDGDSLRKQTQRLSLCKKVVTDFEEPEIMGFRPPEERFNNDTITAAANAGFDYMFVGRIGAQASPKFLKTVGAPGPSMIMISRLIADDHFLYSTSTLSGFDRTKIVDNDWNWIQRLRGLHTYSFHTQNIKAPGHKELIHHIQASVTGPDSFSATPSELIRWWRFREQLLSNQPPSEKDLAQYKPVKLTVDVSGKMTKTPFSFERIRTPSSVKAKE